MYDVLVIGSGPAGYYCALNATRQNYKTAIVEKNKLGGTGFRWGCLPVKYILDEIKKIEDISGHVGITIDKTVAHGDIFRKIQEDMRGIEEKIEEVLSHHEVDIFYGDGTFLDKNTYQIVDQKIKAKNIVIATGTSPAGIMDIQIDKDIVISHEEAISFKQLPESLVIVGGNVEGIEFASLFAYLGCQVTVIEKEETLLLGNDLDLIAPVEENLIRKGVKIIKGIGVIKAEKENGRGKVTLEDSSVIEVDKILITGFRKPNFPQGLETIGVDIDANKILVDDRLRTSIKHIYAVGDINGILGMAHVAISQGTLVVDCIANNNIVTMNYNTLPRAIFTVGEIAGAGYQEWELQQKEIGYRIKKVRLAETWRGFNKGMKEDFLKVLIGEDNVILGIWMYGKNVSELVGSLGLLIDKRVTIQEIKESLFVHPTVSEALLETVLKF